LIYPGPQEEIPVRISNWFRKAVQSRPTTARRSCSLRPQLEQAESRLLLSTGFATITYRGSDGFLQEQIWGVAPNGDLFVHYLNKTGWHTDDHGNANGNPFRGEPSATTYVDASGFNQIQVWAVASNGHLYEHYFDRTGWHTVDQGNANGYSFEDYPAVMTYVDATGFDQIQVWDTTPNGHLYVHYFNRTGWHTDDHGNANGQYFNDGAPAVTTYLDSSGFNQIQVWAVGTNGHLYEHYFDGTGWHTVHQGNANGLPFGADPAVTTYLDSTGFRQIQVWDTATNGHLYAHYFNQTGWHTDDHGNANGLAFVSPPSVTTYVDSTGFDQIQVWDIAEGGHLYAHYFNRTGWHTDDHGDANGLSFNVSGAPSVMTYLDSTGFNQIQVWDFATNGHLYEHYFDQNGWHTIDQGLI
jgi:hypothetical protein